MSLNENLRKAKRQKNGSPDIKVGRSPGRSDQELCDLGRNRLIHGFFGSKPMSLNENLRKAKRQKNDEFYTQRSDIENELRHYTEHFRGKVVYCNCDDPSVSNFFHFFSYNFDRLGLKKLITACYRNQERDLFSRHDSERAIWLEYKGAAKGGRVPHVGDIGIREFEGEGDFRSAECTELLKQADIVVTNPPFSLFREYVAQLVQYGKKFLIVGSQNAVTYKEIFHLIKDNRTWLGVTPKGQDMLFDVPESYAQELVATAKEGSAYRVVEGVIKGRLGNAAWFTNLDHAKRHEELILYKRYSPEEYPAYDNYEMRSTWTRPPKSRWIGTGRWGCRSRFWTSTTRLTRPEQFEVMGITDRDNNSGLKTREYTSADVPNPGDLNRRGVIKVRGVHKPTYVRLLVRRVPPQ